MILWLWAGAMDPLGNLPPFLLQIDGLKPIESDSGRGLSKVVGLELTQQEDCTWKIDLDV